MKKYNKILNNLKIKFTDLIARIEDPNEFWKQEQDKAIIIACYFNTENNKYRYDHFITWYDSIKQYNHKIIECVIDGKENNYSLPSEIKNVIKIKTNSLLWHKESLLNILIKNLELKYKYVFWLDTDIIFQNNHWLLESVKLLYNKYTIIQPFEYCIHLEKDEKIEHNVFYRDNLFLKSQNYFNIVQKPNNVWRSFASNYNKRVNNDIHDLSSHKEYDLHGHVGFAWGARIDVFKDSKYPLYDKALIGGSDHIISHACVGHIPHECIKNSFDDINMFSDIISWSKEFNKKTKNKLGYTQGSLFHLWHGDLNKREYFKRIKDTAHDFKNISETDQNGLYINKNKKLENYIDNYFKNREDVSEIINSKKENNTLNYY